MRRRHLLVATRFIILRGLSACAILLPIFILLKLTGIVAWSWWWVLLPLWIPIAIALAILVGFFLVACAIAAAAIFAELSEKY